MNDHDLIQTTANRQAITDLLYRYCRSMDRIDAELGYTIWHEGSVADYGPDGYQGTGHGFIDWVCEQHRNVVAHSHQISNVIIELDGNRAGSEAYVTMTMRAMMEGGLKHLTVWGRYVDQWEQRGGQWGIVKRMFLRDYDEIRDATPMNAAGIARRDPGDASYKVLGRRHL